LVDLSLPEDDGFTVGQSVLAARPEAVVIGVTPMADPSQIRESRRAGFWGCVSKDVSVPRFTSVVRAAMQGRPVRQPERRSDTRGSSYPSGPFDLLAAQLTPRELEVLAQLAGGAGSSQIARELDISWNTVRTHAQSILTKLQVHSRLEAAAVAVQQGLVPDPAASESGAA
jgi:DNA-binding NarL/FixJ family response regulator